MNRRNFIASALAAVATIPVLGKLVQAKPPKPSYVSREEADRYFAERLPEYCFVKTRDSTMKVYYDGRVVGEWEGPDAQGNYTKMY